MEINGRDTPLVHHSPGAHACSARSAVDRQQVDFGIARPPDGHGQFPHGIGAGLQSHTLGPQAPDSFHFLHESFLVHESETRVAFELLQRTRLESRLESRDFRVRGHDVSPFLQFNRPFEGVYFDLSADALGTLAPFELNGFHAQFADHVFGYPVAGVFHIHLDENVTIPLKIAAVLFHAAVHFRGFLHLALAVEFQVRIDAADIFPANQNDPADRSADRKVVPVLARDFRAAQGSCEDGNLHLHLMDGAEGGFRVDCRKGGFIRVRIHSFCSESIPHDVEVRVVDRIVFVCSGRDTAEGLRIKKLSAPEGGVEHVTASAAPVHTPAAYAGLRGYIPGAVAGLHGFICIGSL